MLRQKIVRKLVQELRPQLTQKFKREASSLAVRATPLSAIDSAVSPSRIALNKKKIVYYLSSNFSSKTLNLDNVFEVKVPEMGESITEATVVEWLKNPGDRVEADETIAVLETDKVSVDVKSPEAGVIVKQLAAVDSTVLVGKPIVQLSKDLTVLPSKAAPKEAEKVIEKTQPIQETSSSVEIEGEVTDIVVPAMGESIVEGTIVECNKKPGDFVAAEEVIAVLETDKISVDVKSEYSGTVKEVFANEGDVIKVGSSLLSITKGKAGSQPSAQSKASVSSTPTEKVSKDIPKKTEAKESVQNKPHSVTKSAEPSISEERTFIRTKMNRMRLRIAERLKESQNIAASLTTFQECDMGNLMDLRKQYKDVFEKKHGVKLGFMSAFVKASAAALMEFPAINSMIDDEKMEIVQPNFVDISVAVSTGKGLVTPVIKDCEHLNFADVEKTLANLALRARDGKLTLADMTGGNFTISNGGVFGSLMGTPILNRPQSAILGMHATKMRPVVYKNEITARPMMYLALTYDHRLVDGREAVLFLKSIADKIENPERLILDI